MDIHASLRFLHMSPRKVRLVIDAVRGLSAQTAETKLTFMNRGAARPVLKLLQSAMANAQNNFHLPKDGLVIKTITADGGPTVKRFRPRAFGRAAPIRKRTTHIRIVLSSPHEVATQEVPPPVAEETKKPAKSLRTSSPRKRTTQKNVASTSNT